MNKYALPKLPYSFNALEPYMDAKTVEIHYTKHHQGYCDKLNNALEKHPALFEKSVEDLLSNLNSVPNDIRTAVINFGGGFVNHNIFWECMYPASEDNVCSGKMLDVIVDNFGSFEEFKKQFSEKAITLFGSGYCWLIVNSEGKLDIVITKDQDSLLSVGKKPILVIDVWEHAYYLKYQNRRVEFIDSWWSLVNWGQVEKNYLSN
jgi:superoxide dismutase, Fe-Mn family